MCVSWSYIQYFRWFLRNLFLVGFELTWGLQISGQVWCLITRSKMPRYVTLTELPTLPTKPKIPLYHAVSYNSMNCNEHFQAQKMWKFLLKFKLNKNWSQNSSMTLKLAIKNMQNIFHLIHGLPSQWNCQNQKIQSFQSDKSTNNQQNTYKKSHSKLHQLSQHALHSELYATHMSNCNCLFLVSLYLQQDNS